MRCLPMPLAIGSADASRCSSAESSSGSQTKHSRAIRSLHSRVSAILHYHETILHLSGCRCPFWGSENLAMPGRLDMHHSASMHKGLLRCYMAAAAAKSRGCDCKHEAAMPAITKSWCACHHCRASQNASQTHVGPRKSLWGMPAASSACLSAVCTPNLPGMCALLLQRVRHAISRYGTPSRRSC